MTPEPPKCHRCRNWGRENEYWNRCPVVNRITHKHEGCQNFNPIGDDPKLNIPTLERIRDMILAPNDKDRSDAALLRKLTAMLDDGK